MEKFRILFNLLIIPLMTYLWFLCSLRSELKRRALARQSHKYTHIDA